MSCILCARATALHTAQWVFRLLQGCETSRWWENQIWQKLIYLFIFCIFFQNLVEKAYKFNFLMYFFFYQDHCKSFGCMDSGMAKFWTVCKISLELSQSWPEWCSTFGPSKVQNCQHNRKRRAGLRKKIQAAMQQKKSSFNRWSQLMIVWYI